MDPFRSLPLRASFLECPVAPQSLRVHRGVTDLSSFSWAPCSPVAQAVSLRAFQDASCLCTPCSGSLQGLVKPGLLLKHVPNHPLPVSPSVASAHAFIILSLDYCRTLLKSSPHLSSCPPSRKSLLALARVAPECSPFTALTGDATFLCPTRP